MTKISTEDSTASPLFPSFLQVDGRVIGALRASMDGKSAIDEGRPITRRLQHLYLELKEQEARLKQHKEV